VSRTARVAALVMAVLATAQVLAQAPAPQTTLTYTSGGVSEEDRDRLTAMAQSFNVKLVLATKSGAYLSDVRLVFRDPSGRPVLDAVAEGPWFLARLPAGRYAVEATANGAAVRKAFVAGPRQTRVDLRWDD